MLATLLSEKNISHVKSSYVLVLDFSNGVTHRLFELVEELNCIGSNIPARAPRTASYPSLLPVIKQIITVEGLWGVLNGTYPV